MALTVNTNIASLNTQRNLNGSAILAQANQLPQSVLSLLR